MTDRHTHRGTVSDRTRAGERVRTASVVAGLGAVLASVVLTAELVPAAAASSVTSTTGTTGSTSTAPAPSDGGGAVAHSGGS
ncbi:MAG: hypothetical protein QOC82_3141 [Frankiaceae bacterium]|jgi:hypothetical protein|nr:hypothetical protein [Frankiaceae bacterium]